MSQLPITPVLPIKPTDENTTFTPTNCNIPAPVWPGRLLCRCTIWGPENCPMVKRVRQDTSFIFAPETLHTLPASALNNITTLSGHEGVFLKVDSTFYLDTFLAQAEAVGSDPIIYARNIYGEIEEDKFKISLADAILLNAGGRRDVGYENDSNRNAGTPLSALTFLPDQGLNGGSTFVPSTSISADRDQTYKSLSGHQTFINFGSLYDANTLKFEKYNTTVEKYTSFDELAEDMRVKWEYRAIEVGAKNNVETKKKFDFIVAMIARPEDFNNVASNYVKKVMPITIGPRRNGDPLDFASLNGLRSSNTTTGGRGQISDGDINPGLHWGLVKRRPLPPNMGFSLSFFRQAEDPLVMANGNNQYRMQTRFKWLCPYQLNQLSNCSGFDNQGQFSQESIDEAKLKHYQKWDLAQQQYIIVKLPLVTNVLTTDTEDKRADSGQYNQLYLFIAENSPISVFKLGGFRPQCKAKTASRTQDSESRGVSCKPNDANAGQDTEYQYTEVSYAYDENFIQEISQCDFVSASELFQRKELKINIRPHLGKLVIQFGGFEDKFWVITNNQMKPSSLQQDINTVQITSKNIPIQFCFDLIEIYGGNFKTAVHYAPLKYVSGANIPFENLSVDGPAVFREVEFTLSDKYYYGDNKTTYNTNYARRFVETNVGTGSKIVNRSFSPNNPPADSNVNGHRYTTIACLGQDCFKNIGTNSKYKRLVSATLQLAAGSVYLPDTDNDRDFFLQAADTPILKLWRLVVPAAEKAWNVARLDVSDYVLEFSDDWSESDWMKMEHSGQISFYLQSNKEIGRKLYDLQDKNFYIQVGLAWDRPDLGDNLGLQDKNQIEGKKLEYSSAKVKDELLGPVEEPIRTERVLITGFCQGGTVTVETNKQIFSCKINDYSKILDDQMFFNSPFFDRMVDIFAVREIVQMAGFNTNATAFLDTVINDYDNFQQNKWSTYTAKNGRVHKIRNYILAGSYDLLQNPMLKFGDNTAFSDGISKICTMASKISYFNTLGEFIIENLPFDEYIFDIGNKLDRSAQDAEAYRLALNAKAHYYVSPRDFALGSKIGYNAFKDSTIIDEVVNPGQDVFRNVDLDEGKLSDAETDVQRVDELSIVLDSYTIERVVPDVRNEIKIITSTPNGEILIAADLNYDSLYDTTKIGFLGYRKMFIQMDGIFGSEDTVKKMVSHYTKFYTPPLRVKFKAIGRNGLQALDIITLQGLGSGQRQPLIISTLKNTINASQNTWYQDIEALWIFSGNRVDFGDTKTYELDVTGPKFNTQ